MKLGARSASRPGLANPRVYGAPFDPSVSHSTLFLDGNQGSCLGDAELVSIVLICKLITSVYVGTKLPQPTPTTRQANNFTFPSCHTRVTAENLKFL